MWKKNELGPMSPCRVLEFQQNARNFIFHAVAVLGFITVSFSCRAKIVDCPPIVSKGVEYSSHSNYVQAVEQSTRKILWRTALFTEVYTRKFDPNLEEDVQWNIACIREVRTSEVLVSDRRARVFHVNRTNGSLIATEKSSK